MLLSETISGLILFSLGFYILKFILKILNIGYMTLLFLGDIPVVRGILKICWNIAGIVAFCLAYFFILARFFH